MSGAFSGAALRYDKSEDRMVLSFDAAGQRHRVWITRRQCAGLIKSLGPAALKAAAQLPLPRGKGPAAARGPRGEDAPPVLAEISLRRSAKSVRLGFKSGGETVPLDCSTAEFVKLQCLLYRFAGAVAWSLEPEKAARAADGAGKAVARRLH